MEEKLSNDSNDLKLENQKNTSESNLDHDIHKAENNGSMTDNNEDTIDLDDENNDKKKYLGVDSGDISQ